MHLIAVTILHTSGAWWRAVWQFLRTRIWGQLHRPNSWYLFYELRDVTSCSTVIHTIAHSLLTRPGKKTHIKLRKKKLAIKTLHPWRRLQQAPPPRLCLSIKPRAQAVMLKVTAGSISNVTGKSTNIGRVKFVKKKGVTSQKNCVPQEKQSGPFD
jgi:hypothetical protein